MSKKLQAQKVVSTLAGKYQRLRIKADVPVLEQGMLLILSKDTTPEMAQSALERLRKDYIDWNEMRVSGIPELVDRLACLKKDQHIVMKAQRVREFVNQIFNIRHTLNLEPMREEGREKQEKFLVSLECLDPYMIDAFLVNLSADQGLHYSPAATRVLLRIGLLAKGSSPAKQRADMESMTPGKDAQNFLALLSRHAEDVCLAKNPLCGQCALLSQCKFGKAQTAQAKAS